MTFDELRDLTEGDKETGSKIKTALENFIQAEIDWRTDVKVVEEFIEIIEDEVGESSKENVSKALKRYEVNVMTNAWEAESFTSLLEVFEYDKNKTLKEIFEEIKLELFK